MHCVRPDHLLIAFKTGTYTIDWIVVYMDLFLAVNESFTIMLRHIVLGVGV